MKARYLPLIGMLLAGPALAEISYDYIEFGYGVTSVDVLAPQDGDGMGPEGFASYQFFGPFTAFVGGNYRDFEDDNVELSNLETGFGWTASLGKNASTFFNVSYLWTEVETPGFTYDQDGYGATLGYRAENHTPWEFVATLDYVNVESGVEFGGGMSLVYDATRRFGVTGGFSYFDESMTGFLGVRYFLTHRH